VRKIACPACHAAFEISFAALKASEAVTCPSCGKPFRVRRYKAQAAASATFETLTGFPNDPKGS